MPKIVDHEQRRREITAALWRIVERDGIKGLRLREIAQEAGMPTGTASYYFKNQADLLVGALRESIAQSTTKAHKLDLTAGDPDIYLEAICHAVPTTAKRRKHSTIWLEVVAQAQASEGLRAELGEIDRLGRAEFREFLQHMADAGLVDDERDLDAEAATLHALVDGLTLHTMTDAKNMPAQSIRTILGNYLDHLASTPIFAVDDRPNEVNGE